ncbi:transcriptional regulator [Streptomyces palmae]|uniref:Transcriptional regulator n=1 Tax=Streptomyces palmae TaxID=1701085 RepID=A0A4Z0HJ11_9ACTN|nr:transcriptional regulator [Streptomyces palmae]TGB18428.1 transcriptional regulator [Streptomyces palmae]
MTDDAARMVAEAVARLAPQTAANRLVPRIAEGTASRDTLAAFVLEQHHIVRADRFSFRHLAQRAGTGTEAAAFFAHLVQGEDIALERLAPPAAACGLDQVAVRAYEPLAGCQAYPSYVARLALTAEPAEVVLALAANFAAWGGYCATVGRALRLHYGFSDAACGFFDFFADPDPDTERLTHQAVRAGLAEGRLPGTADRHGRLLQSYELMFWNTLAD